ncbi:hypothetical protein C6381_06725, partial [Pseudomonas syringae pv. actinidiae]
MESTQQPEDDGIIRIQRLVPGQVDVVLGSHPSRQRRVQPRPYGLWLAGLIVAGCLAGLVASQVRGPKVAPLPPVEHPVAEAQTPVIDSEPAAPAAAT